MPRYIAYFNTSITQKYTSAPKRLQQSVGIMRVYSETRSSFSGVGLQTKSYSSRMFREEEDLAENLEKVVASGYQWSRCSAPVFKEHSQILEIDKERYDTLYAILNQ